MKVQIANGDCNPTCFKTRGPKVQTVIWKENFKKKWRSVYIAHIAEINLDLV